jgi:hypothetical protein
MRIRHSALATAIALSGTLLAGCGPDCESTCNTLYQTNECGLQSAGWQQSELLNKCLDECTSALDNPGKIRKDYQPSEYTPSNQDDVTFTNDEEVALWMDCVSETACDLLADGYCAPVW